MDNTIVAIILCILIPPLAVFLMKGAGIELVISIVLWFLGGIPGMLYALWLKFA